MDVIKSNLKGFWRSALTRLAMLVVIIYPLKVAVIMHEWYIYDHWYSF